MGPKYVLMFALHICFLSSVCLLLVCYAHDFPCTFCIYTFIHVSVHVYIHMYMTGTILL